MLLARHVARLGWQLLVTAGRTGLWWLPIIVPALALAAFVVATAKVVVPTAMYVFF